MISVGSIAKCRWEQSQYKKGGLNVQQAEHDSVFIKAIAIRSECLMVYTCQKTTRPIVFLSAYGRQCISARRIHCEKFFVTRIFKYNQSGRSCRDDRQLSLKYNTRAV